MGGLLVAACASSDNPVGGPGLGSGDTTASAETTTSEPDDDADDGQPADSSTGSPPPGDSSSSDGAGADSTTSGSADDTTGMPPDDSACPLGEDGCPCDAGDCDFGLMCIDDVCGVPGACPADVNEANETEATATDLGMIEDCNSDGDMLSGVLDGQDDVDWFQYSGDDVAFCTVDPERTLAVDGPVRFCKFVECNASLQDTEISCPEGVTQSQSPDGRPGCCSDDGFAFDDINCPGIDDDATVYLRLDQPANMCAAYTLSYHY